MAAWKNEAEARQEILDLVGEYYHQFMEPVKEFEPGDRIS